MLIDGCKIFVIRCLNCGRLMEYEFNIFEIMGKNKVDYRCHCGKLNMVIKKKKQAGLNAEIDCYSCGDKHIYNFKVFSLALEKINKLNRTNKIGCDCGNPKISLKAFPDRIELRCINCNGIKLIFVETDEDLSVLLKKDKILIRENNISCIDSINERNRDIND